MCVFQNVLNKLGCSQSYRASYMVVDLVWITWILIVPLSAHLCLGWKEFRRSGLAAEQKGGTLKSKSTKPRSMIRWDTLYCRSEARNAMRMRQILQN